MAWAGDTPVCDWRNEMREAFVVTELPLLMIGLFGGIGGGTRAELAAPYWPFFTGGCGGDPECCTLWARIIVATFDPLELSCRKTWPGDIDRAIPVAKSKSKFYIYWSFGKKLILLGPETGTLETVAVGWITFATLLIIGFAPAPSAAFFSDSFSMRRRMISASRSLTLQFLNVNIEKENFKVDSLFLFRCKVPHHNLALLFMDLRLFF